MVQLFFHADFWFVHIPPSPLGINLKAPHVETDPRATEEAKDTYRSLHLSGNVEARFSICFLPFCGFTAVCTS